MPTDHDTPTEARETLFQAVSESEAEEFDSLDPMCSFCGIKASEHEEITPFCCEVGA